MKKISNLNVYHMRRFGWMGLLVVVFLSSCLRDIYVSPEEQLAEDLELIDQYLEDNNLTAQSTSTGLHYIIEDAGDNDRPTVQDEVTVAYRGYLLDGTVFDESDEGNPVTFPLGNVIQGWQEGIPLYGRGGKGVLIIPSGLGYGSNSPGSIPRNSVLVFDIEVVDF
jgi:FKBP-type peptidyl-prolyl cis-trans isomerase FkpA